jgi:hypothetical protein
MINFIIANLAHTAVNTQKYDAQSFHERISTSSLDSLNASAHGNEFVMSSLQHCVLLLNVPQPFARECHAEESIMNDEDSTTRVTQSRQKAGRSLISGCGMGAGFALVPLGDICTSAH